MVPAMSLPLPLHNMDTAILLALNANLVGTDFGMKLFNQIGNNPLIRGFPLFFSLIYVWFESNSLERRSRCLLGLFAACLAAAVSYSTQERWTPHLRPLLDAELHLRLLDKVRLEDWAHRRGSFPSDTASLYFALCTIVFLENRRLGFICFAWTLLSVGVARVALGWHYPSDIMGGIFLGTTSIYLASHMGWMHAAIQRGLVRLGTGERISVCVYFMLLADAYNLFPGLQGLHQAAKGFLAFLLS